MRGELAGRLPSEVALAAQYGVSRDTVRRSLIQLGAEGLVRGYRGRGTFVVPPAERRVVTMPGEELDDDAEQPVSEQIAAILRRDIEDGVITARLPAEQQLALRFGVTRRTVRRGLEILAAEGLITARRGRGTFVAPEHRKHA
jgi:DNA-binding GntR family transcriptional regulator